MCCCVAAGTIIVFLCHCRNYHVLLCRCRNYHVFYYLMVGSSEEQKERLGITKPDDFHYLNQVVT